MIHIIGPIIPDEIAIQIPQLTDNDFPPLNFKKGEKILPIIEDIEINTKSQESIPKDIARIFEHNINGLALDQSKFKNL